MIVDPDAVAAAIAEIAEDEILSRYGALAANDIRTKSSPQDFVTEADVAAENALRAALSDFLPDAGFVGEESAAADPDILRILGGKGRVWVVDPLDGTKNFIQQRDQFGTIVALVENGVTIMGWIYAIPERKCAVALKNGGTFWGGERIVRHSSIDKGIAGYRAIGALDTEWERRLRPQLNAHFETRAGRCSAYIYIELGRGLAPFAIYGLAHPWDHAAGALLLSETGGNVAYLDTGEIYSPFSTTGRPLLAAATADIYSSVSETLLRNP
ncbi:MAG: inositol monophosphatase family protein [Pseudomonadota bacterium]